MKVHIGNTNTNDSQSVEVRMFEIEMSNGTRFRISEEPLDFTIAVLRIGLGPSVMHPLTITPVVSNKVILS